MTNQQYKGEGKPNVQSLYGGVWLLQNDGRVLHQPMGKTVSLALVASNNRQLAVHLAGDEATLDAMLVSQSRQQGSTQKKVYRA